MYITTPNNVDVADFLIDINAALAVARLLYAEYFEKEGKVAEAYYSENRKQIGELIGVITDYTRSAKALAEKYEKQIGDV